MKEFDNIIPEYREMLENVPEEVKQRFMGDPKLTKEQIELLRKIKAKKITNQELVKK